MAIEFIDNTVKVKEALYDAVEAFLYETGGELQARIERNSRVDTGQTKRSYEYKVSVSSAAGEGKVTVGSPLQNAIWEELGTGEYALNGDGRKEPWVYRDRNGNYRHTTGKKPNRPMYRAANTLRPKLKKGLEKKLRERLGRAHGFDSGIYSK